MRKPLGLFVAAFATVAGGGLAVALEGGGRAEPNEVVQESTTTETLDTTTSSSTTDTTDTSTTAVDEVVEVEGEGGEHGARVSQAAHDCHAMVEAGEVNPETGEPYRNHGECVSRVARDHDGDGTPDTPPVDGTDDTEVEDELPGEGRGHTEGAGRGHGQGRGRGHERDG